MVAIGNGVTAPQLLPVTPPQFDNQQCESKVDGEITLRFFVDGRGVPQNITFIKPLGTELDWFALKIVHADRFKPATQDGRPVVAEQTDKMKLRSCVNKAQDASGRKMYSIRLRSWPEQSFAATADPPLDTAFALETDGKDDITHLERVGGSVTRPVPLLSPQTKYTDEAKRNHITGICLLTLVVDRHGMPQQVKVIRPIGYGLDQTAMEAVNRYRFIPAMRNGVPQPVQITIEVNFNVQH